MRFVEKNLDTKLQNLTYDLQQDRRTFITQ